MVITRNVYSWHAYVPVHAPVGVSKNAKPAGCLSEGVKLVLSCTISCKRTIAKNPLPVGKKGVKSARAIQKL